MGKNTLLPKMPLNCPFCDEPAYMKDHSTRIVTPFKIYTLRECCMGHQFYSIDFAPENQSEVVEEIREFKAERRRIWKETSNARRAKNKGL